MTNLQIYILNKKEKTFLYIGTILSGLLLSILLYRSILFTLLIIPFFPKINKFASEKLMKKRLRDFRLQFKDFLFMLSTSIATGRSMSSAIGEAIPAIQSIYGEKSILAIEMQKVSERISQGGENDIVVLTDLVCSSGVEDVADFVSIYSICKSSGANLILALNRAASVIIDKMTIEKEIDELVRRKESEGLVIFIMPIIVILFLNLCAPDYISILYERIAGRIIMTITIVTEILVYEMIQKIINIEI